MNCVKVIIRVWIVLQQHDHGDMTITLHLLRHWHVVKYLIPTPTEAKALV